MGQAVRDAAYSGDAAKILNAAGLGRAKAEITSWPGYAKTPLRSLDGLARTLGLARVLYKDEAHRFGLKSFKALGGAYAVLEILRQAAAEGHRRADITVAAATDGNHGRAVAWGAQTFGCRCVIYLHKGVSARREAEIAHYGARIQRVDGDYVDSVRSCAADAAENGWTVVADTALEGEGWRIPSLVMQGYELLIDEVLEQWPGGGAFSHVFVQGGVGGLAAAVAGYLWEHLGADRPHVVVVEPARADCIFRSIAARAPTPVPGDAETFMACLSAGEVSPVAWPILEAAADHVITLPDQAAAETMRLLAAGTAGDAPIVAGESGGAATAGLIAATLDQGVRTALGLDASTVALVIGSEGATDPETYERVVGRSAEAVAG